MVSLKRAEGEATEREEVLLTHEGVAVAMEGRVLERMVRMVEGCLHASGLTWDGQAGAQHCWPDRRPIESDSYLQHNQGASAGV